MNRPIRYYPLLAGAMLLSAACASSSPPPRSLTAPAPPPDPAPQLMHLLTLASPTGDGKVTLWKRVRHRAETDPFIIRLKLQRNEKTYSTLEDYQPEGAIRAGDELGQWTFGYSPLDLSGSPIGLAIHFQNRSSNSIQVDWSRSALVDASARSRRLIHRGVKLADRGATSPPSTVPAGAVLDDFIFPAEAIFFTSGRYGGWNAVPFFETLKPGASLSLLMALQSGGQVIERTFRFSVTAGQP